MIRRLLLMMSIVAVAGLGPAVAQDIFINKYKDKVDGGKPAIFLKPKSLQKSSKTSKTYKNFSKDRLKTAKLKKISLEKLQTLEDWRNAGIKPQTAEEVAAHAAAHRAVNQNLMYERREALIEHLAKKERKRRARIASRADSAYKTSKESSEVKSKESGAHEASVSKKQTAPKKKSVYVKAKKKDDGKPKKLFNNYR